MPSNSTRCTTVSYANLCEKWSKYSVLLHLVCASPVNPFVQLQGIVEKQWLLWYSQLEQHGNFHCGKGILLRPYLISFTPVWIHLTCSSPPFGDSVCAALCLLHKRDILQVMCFSYINNFNKTNPLPFCSSLPNGSFTDPNAIQGL